MSCPKDRAEQPISNFYMSYSEMHSDGRLPMCQTCIKEKCYVKETDDIDISKFKDILRQLDKPYLESVMQSSISQYNKTYAGKTVPSENRTKIIGYYFKNIQTLRQYVTLNWKEGVEVNAKQLSQTVDGVTSLVEEKYDPRKIEQDKEERYHLDGENDFVVTQEMIRTFGAGYKKSEYRAMWEKYQFLKQSYPDVTNLHTEALVTYVRFKVKEEIATALGMSADAKNWSDIALKAAEKAKINPSQLSQSDLQGGVNSFCELMQAVEQAVDVIPILPKFKFRPVDAIDFSIWCFVNYLRDLEGKPKCSYEDVYKFYDKRKKEYIEQYGDPYGIFEEDTSENNRKSIKKFITLPNESEVSSE